MAKTGRHFQLFVQLIIIPLLIINAYAFWRLDSIAKGWKLQLFPNSIAASMTQMAIILAVNTAIIIMLLLYIGGRK